MQACTAPVNEAPISPIRAGTSDQTSTLRSSSAFGKQHKATFALKVTDRRNCYKVEEWTKNGSKVDYMLYAGSNLDKAQAVFAAAIKHRPRIRLTIRQRTQLLEQWPKLTR
jgi:hypothetical protein